MKKSILYSIVIPTKNRKKLLRKCIRSIENAIKYANLSYDKFELIVVYDGCKEYAPVMKFKNYSCIENNISIGCGMSRSKGFEKSSGKYVFLFDDDVLLTKKYFMIFEKIKKNINFDILGGRPLGQTKNLINSFAELLAAKTSRILNFIPGGNLIINKKKNLNVKFSNRLVEDYYLFQNKELKNANIYFSRSLCVYHYKINFIFLFSRLYRYCKDLEIDNIDNLQKSDIKIQYLNDGISLRKVFNNYCLIKKLYFYFLGFLLLLIFLFFNPNFLLNFKKLKRLLKS